MRSALAAGLHGIVLHDGSVQHRIAHLHVVHWYIHTSPSCLHVGHVRLDTAHTRLHRLYRFLDTIQSLLDAIEGLCHLVTDAIHLQGKSSNALRGGCVLCAGIAAMDARLVVVLVTLDLEAPLIAQRHLANSLGSPRAIDLARAGVALLSGAVVLDTAAIADQVVPGRLVITIIGSAKLDDSKALVLGYALDRRDQILKARVNAVGRRSKRTRRGGIVWRHVAHRGRRGSRRARARGAQCARVAVDDDARGDRTVMGGLRVGNVAGRRGCVTGR